MIRSARGRRGALALLLAALCLAVPANAAPAVCAVADAMKTGPDDWTQIAAPQFSEGGDTMTTYAVDEQRPDRLFATNGVGIAYSRDSGCTWANSTLPAEELGVLAPLGGESGGVAQRHLIDVQLPYFAGSAVWAIGRAEVVSVGSPLVEPRVLLSVDGGRTFTRSSAGLPRFARPLALRAGMTAATAYVLVEETVPTSTVALYETTTAGARWTRKSTGLPFSDFVVDPFRAGIWAWSARGLGFSADGGATWQGIAVPGPPTHLDVAPYFTTIAFEGGTRYDVASMKALYPRPVPDPVNSITAGPDLGMVATSSVTEGATIDPPQRVFDRKTIDVTPEDVTLSDLNFAQVMVDGEYVLYGFHPRALYRRFVPPDFAVPPPPRPIVDIKKVVPPKPPKLALVPEGDVITLKPGEKRRIDYDLVMPPTPTPLDVYFMTDSTGSMGDAIAAVQGSVQDIVDELTAAGINLHFGVADFRDWPNAPGPGATYPYKRHRAVGPIDDDLGDALASITTGGGNGDDSALEAIYQAVTGAGRTGLTASIPEGEGAEFRPDALKVVLIASDEEMRDPSPTEPWNAGPSKDEVIRVLNDAGVEIVGIRVKTTSGGDPRPEMEELARGAGSLAPEDGVDCDGDDEADLDGGDPLVCDFTSGDDSIAPAFIGMLRGIKDLADINVGVEGPKDVVRHLGDVKFEAVNVKALNTFPVPVEYACTAARYGTDTPVEISSVVRGQAVVAETKTVRCLAPPGPKAPPPARPPAAPPEVTPKEPPPPVRAAAVAPPPPPQPNPNVNPNPNPNPQAQGQGGMASQEEQQHQLALAENDLGEDEELAFSAVDNRKAVTPAVTLVVGMVVACAAAGTQLHLARRTRVATNPSGARR